MLGGVRHGPEAASTTRRDRDPWIDVEAMVDGKQIFSALLPDDLYVEPDHPLTGEWDDRRCRWWWAVLCGVFARRTWARARAARLCRDKGGVACMRFQADPMRLTNLTCSNRRARTTWASTT